MKADPPIFTATQLAYLLGCSRKQAHLCMAGAERHIRTVPVRGVPARCWPVSAIPTATAARLAQIVQRGGYCSLAHLFAKPPEPWQPAAPLARIAPAAVAKAELRRVLLAPVLSASDAQTVPVSELVRRAVRSFANLPDDAKPGGEWAVRQWIEDAIERDRNLWDWQRLEIYLDAQPTLKRSGDDGTDAALRDVGGDELAAALEKVQDRTAPTGKESVDVWAAAFTRFVFLVEEGTTEGKAKRALLRILARSGLPLFADTASARSKAWQRNFERWKGGLRLEEAFADGRKRNRRPAVFELSEPEVKALRHFRLEKDSLNLAIRFFYKSPACRTETRLLIERYENEAAQRRRAVNWPMSLRRAAHITAEEWALFRGQKKYQEVEMTAHRAMWHPGPDGERVPERPNSIFESDDMSINEPFSFMDPETGTVSIGRQTLCTQDVFSASWLSVMPVGRTRDAYRVEDEADHMLETVLAHGLPDVWRLERGVWENNFIDGIPLKDGTRWGGLRHLFHVERTYKPGQKGGIESGFNLKQAFLAHESTTIGRKRGEFEKGTKLMMRAKNGDEAAIAKFWPIGACADAMCAAAREFNATPKKRRAFGRDVVAPDDLYRNVVRRECPADELWRFCPVKREASVRRGCIEVSVMHYPEKFCFRVNGNEAAYLEHGHPVLIAFHPGHPERGCHIFNAERGARNREGYKFGEWLMVAPFVEPMPQYGMPFGHPEMQARKRANAAVSQEFRSIATSGARVSVVRTSHGKSVRLENGTGMPLVDRTAKPIKEQRAELRKTQADAIEREAEKKQANLERLRAELPAKRIAAKRRLGIFDAEVIAAQRAEEEAAQEAKGIFSSADEG